MKTNPNWLPVPENPGVTPSSRQCRQNTADCKGWAQQPARIKELLTRKDGTVYKAVLEFCKEDRAPETLALGTSKPPEKFQFQALNMQKFKMKFPVP